MHFAVIGTREPTEQQISHLKEILKNQDIRDILHTGAAVGIDQIAAETWMKLGGYVCLHQPYASFQWAWIKDMIHTYGSLESECNLDQEDMQLAEAHHPKWSTLREFVWKLHARNVRIVRGCDIVYAYPGTKPWGGGTAMGIKIATHLDIQVEVYDKLERDWSHCGCN